MLSFDNSAVGLFHPGRGPYFDGLALNLVPFETERQDYSRRNAWWLAELSRLIYRTGPTPNDVVQKDRPAILRDAGLVERNFFAKGGVEAALIGAPNFDVLVFRGTDELTNWLQDLKFDFDRWPNGKGRVHAGFLAALELVWRDIDNALRNVRGPLFITGHSLGAALATLAGARRACRAVYAFGSPLVGDATFVAHYPKNVPVHRVINDNDAVATVPPVWFGFKHVGEGHFITEDGRLVTARRVSGILLAKKLFRILKTIGKKDIPIPDCLTDHAPVNYVAWMQRLAG